MGNHICENTELHKIKSEELTVCRGTSSRNQRLHETDFHQDQMEEFDNPSRTLLHNNFLKTPINASNDLLVLSKQVQNCKAHCETPKVKEQHQSLKKISFFDLQSLNEEHFKSSLLSGNLKNSVQLKNREETKTDAKRKASIELRLSDIPIQEKETRTSLSNSVAKSVADYILSDRNVYTPIAIKKQHFISLHRTNILSNYDFLQKIGEGSFGNVYKAVKKQSNELRAVKVFKKINRNQQKMQNILWQMQILKRLDHPNILKIYEGYFFQQRLYIVTQYCAGGSILEHLQNNILSTEENIKDLIRKLVSAVCYIHNHNVIHRDLKLQNIVFLKSIDQRAKSEDFDLKVIDFGLAKIMQYKKMKDRNKIGTYTHMAPQVLNGFYTQKCDIWACGIILHILLVGYNPFKGSSKEDTFDKIRHETLSFRGPEWRDVGDDARDLLLRMLDKNTSTRINAENILNHPWLLKRTQMIDSRKICKNITDRIYRYYRGNNLISIIESFLTHRQITQKEIEEFTSMFNALDKDKNGLIDLTELKRAFQKHNNYQISQKSGQYEYILSKIDKDFSGFIQISEFTSALFDHSRIFARDSLLKAFDYLDKNGNGFIQKAQLISILRECNRGQVQSILKDMDTNGDNLISKQQFLAYILQEKYK